MLRDEPSTTPIPDEFKPSDYDSKRLAELNSELAKLKSMSASECESQAKKAYAEAVKYHQKGIEKDAALKAKYEAMLAEVAAYNPPSRDHVKFKEFMEEQITESIKFDCSGNYHQDALKNLKPLTGKQWLREQADSCQRGIASAAKGQADENKRAAERTLWVKQLRESLKP